MLKLSSLKIGSCYKVLDGVDLKIRGEKNINVNAGDIVLLLQIHYPGDRNTDSPWGYDYGLKFLVHNKIGWWTFTGNSHTFSLISQNKILVEVVDNETCNR